MRSRRIWAGLTLLLAGGALRAQDGVLLRRPFTPGTYLLAVDIHDVRTYTGQDPEHPGRMALDTRLEFSAKVGDPDSQGRVPVTFTVRRVQARVQARGREIDYDSASPPKVLNQLQHVLSGLVGRTSRATLSRNVLVLSVEGLDAWWDEQARRNPDLLPLIGQIRTELGDERIKGSLERILEKLPAVKVAPKQHWTARMHVPVPLAGLQRYRQPVLFERVQGPWARLHLGGRVSDDSQTRLRTENPALTARNLSMAQGAYLDVLVEGPRPGYRLLLRRELTLTMQARRAATEGQPERTYTATLKQEWRETITILPALAATSRPAGEGG